MSKVDWSKAPEGAEFWCCGLFYKTLNGKCLYFAGASAGWVDSTSAKGELIESYVDFYENPHHIADTTKKEWPTETRIDNIGRNRTEDDMGHYDEQREQHEAKQATKWTANHYESFYELTAEDVKAGKIRVDPYFVSMAWKLGQKDNTGVLFHQLKTISRFGEKHDVEREIRALYNQVLCLAKLMRVDLK